MKTLIKNGRIVTAVDDYRADILFEDETMLSAKTPCNSVIQTGLMLNSTKDRIDELSKALDKAFAWC